MPESNTTRAQCDLGPSGFTRTINGVYGWAGAVVEAAREELGSEPIKLHLWAYRHRGHEYLAADFHTDSGKDYSISFLTNLPHDFDMYSPCVPDMTEALHMVGIVAEALSATIEVGRRTNEVNQHCTPDPWRPDQTNGHLVLA